MTEEIKHINEKNQEYIAEGNRMIKEIINSDGSRNWQANILLDNIKRLEQENNDLKKQIESDKGLITVGGKQQCQYLQKIDELKQENKELKEWKDKVVKLFESACRCKYLNEETDICSYAKKKCININKCVYKYQELSDTYRSALEEIRNTLNRIFNICDDDCGNANEITKVVDKINEVLNDN